MTAALVQYKVGLGGSTATFDTPVTPGNLIVIVAEVQDGAGFPANTGGSGVYTGLTTQIGGQYQAHSYFGGMGGIFYRFVEPGDGDTWGINNSSGTRQVIIAEFSGVENAAGTATQSTGVNATGLALTVDPSVPSLIVGGFATRLEYPGGTFSPNASSTWVSGALAGQNHDNALLLYAISGGSATTVGGTQGGSSRDGYWWGGAAAAFDLIAPPAPDPGVVLDPTGADPVPISDDIISWHIQRGAAAEITGGAQIGTATVVLKNSLEAGADSDDKYNPDNASSPLIDYLRDGTAIHVAVNNDGTLSGSDPRGMFGGRTKDWTVLPSEGTSVAPKVEVTCEDALGWLGRTPVTLRYVQGRAQDRLRTSILTAAGESRIDLAHEIETMPLSAGEGTALGLLEELNKANGTRHFIRPANSSVDWYTYTTRNRQYRLDATPDYSLNQQTDHVTAMDGWRLSADTVTNQQKATVTPIRFTPSTYPVWTSETLPVAVTAARPFEVWVQFDDYVEAPAVNSAHSGATPTITLTAFGTTAKLTITVASGTCTFSALSIEGALARRLPEQSWVADDLTSQALPRGVRSGSEISGEYVGTLSTARGIAEHVVWRYATPQRRPSVTVTNWIPDMFEVQLYDLIAYTSPQLGVTDRLFEVVGITHDAAMAATSGVSHTAQFVLQECRVQDAADFPWFYLDDASCLLDDGVSLLAY